MIVAGKLARFLPEISFYHYIGTDDRVVGVVPECLPPRACPPARGGFGFWANHGGIAPTRASRPSIQNLIYKHDRATPNALPRFIGEKITKNQDFVGGFTNIFDNHR